MTTKRRIYFFYLQKLFVENACLVFSLWTSIYAYIKVILFVLVSPFNRHWIKAYICLRPDGDTLAIKGFLELIFPKMLLSRSSSSITGEVDVIGLLVYNIRYVILFERYVLVFFQISFNVSLNDGIDQGNLNPGFLCFFYHQFKGFFSQQSAEK